MSAPRPRARWVAAAALAWAAVCAADGREAEKIGSLEERTVEVRPGNRISDSTAKARANYREFLELVSDDPELRAEAMRRLADLELEAAQEQQMSAPADANGSGFADAVALLKELLDAYPEYRRSDKVLYQLARANEIAGNTDEALRVLDELVDRFPATAIIDEVEFRRGEMLFLKREYAGAEAAYRKVVEHGESSRFFEQSLYKLGWSRFKLAEYEQSLDPFFELLDRKIAGHEIGDGDERLQALGRAERELVEDTFRVVSIDFSYMEGADSIVQYLDRRGHPDYGYVIYMNLGDLFLEKERYVDAANAFDAFVRQDPYHGQAPLLQVEAIEAYKQGEFPTLVLEGKRAFVERYGMESPYWQRNPRQEHPEVLAHLKANLTDLARYYHAEAQKEGDASAYREAARWYRRYLDYFPGEPDSAGTNFLLAEILFESGDYETATAEYEHTAYDYARHEHSSEAAYAALLSYLEHEKTLAGRAKTDWHRRYLDSGLKFADTYPEHPETGAVLMTVAEDLFRQRQYDLAIAVGRAVIEKTPRVADPLARTAWTVIAHSQFDLGNYAEAEAAYIRLRPLTPRDDRKAAENIDQRIASSIYKQGEMARDSGDLEGAVQHFMRVGRAVPDSGIRATAEYDAAAALINLEAWDRAAATLETFRREHPDSEFADEVTQKLAVAYLESGRGTDAASEFVRIADDTASAEQVKREALWKAAELYKSGNQRAREQQVLLKIVERYPEPVAESIEARVRLLELAEAGGDAGERTALLRDIVAADRAAGAERSDRTRYLAAKAMLELAEPARRRFYAVRLTQPLADSLQLKKERMEDALKAYGRAADYGVAEVTTAATWELAQVYRQFSRDLVESERPDELDAAALEEYELLLEEQAFPFEEKAIELYEANTARAADGVYDDSVRKSFTALAQLVPARYAKLERGEDVVTTLF